MTQAHDTTTVFTFTKSTRTPVTTAVLAGLCAVTLILGTVLQAHWVVIALLTLITAPLAYEWAVNRTYALRMDETRITWSIGAATHEIALAEIDHFIVKTGLDTSVKVTIVPHEGKKIRLHPGCTPPKAALLAALEARNLKMQDRMFGFLG